MCGFGEIRRLTCRTVGSLAEQTYDGATRQKLIRNKQVYAWNIATSDTPD